MRVYFVYLDMLSYFSVWSALWEIHNLFQSEFSRGYELVLPLSVFSSFFFPYGRTIAVYVFFLVFSSLMSLFLSSVTCFIRQFLCKMWQFSLPSFILLCVGFSFPSWLFVILLYFSHVWTNWSSPSFSSTTLQNFQCISNIFPKCPSFSTVKSYAQNIALR